MSLNVDALFGQMVAAGSQAFGDGWAQVETFAKLEFRTLAERIKDIGAGLANNDFDLATAKMLLAMQVNLAVAAIAGATTLVILAVEAAINAVLAVIRGFVNAAVGAVLL
ncbi:MAG TPA: hypothetical protein VEA38_14900 [Terriglobales bacterium]|nr:hypothetical protein [Terriglobales bacterium]